MVSIETTIIRDKANNHVSLGAGLAINLAVRVMGKASIKHNIKDPGRELESVSLIDGFRGEQEGLRGGSLKGWIIRVSIPMSPAAMFSSYISTAPSLSFPISLSLSLTSSNAFPSSSVVARSVLAIRSFGRRNGSGGDGSSGGGNNSYSVGSGNSDFTSNGSDSWRWQVFDLIPPPHPWRTPRAPPLPLRGLPPNSFSSSSSDSDFEFTVSLSPTTTYSTLCPADELFYKGQLLPLHLSPRISMVRTLLLSSTSSSSSTDSTTTTATASRDSTSSSSSDLLLPDSARPSSATADEDPHPLPPPPPKRLLTVSHYFSSLASRFLHRSSSKRSTPKEVFKKYVKKVKPLFSKKSDDLAARKTFSFSFSHSQSFSGNLRCPRRRTCAGSCPSSMRSSPSHSGLLYAGGTFPAPTNSSSSSSMEELQSAIQGAIAHCKSSLVIGNQKKGFCSLMLKECTQTGN
ncbi:probable membrane-associated kinase regulator 1 [Dioscorea cayenensis subsp. rotundata]|uniref:Probable membrane-associated kinase regulator 1 n=1 Tax=Dioscorea cayennensis subsp. rotundata TaxID=55577 RepID=A0AB40C7E6_DIOCR|nr:probable membrane-associated kinase regulator 1 [Dioscorea cayenensis subsp. rotundata]